MACCCDKVELLTVYCDESPEGGEKAEETKGSVSTDALSHVLELEERCCWS